MRILIATTMISVPYAIDFAADKVRAGVVADYRQMPYVVRPVQTHSCNTVVIYRDGAIPNLDDTDAIICLRPDITIGVRTADCVPVLIHCPDLGAVAAIHAGWKGTLGGIVANALQRLRGLGADLSKAEVAFGPSICGACYEVSPEMAEDFAAAGYADCLISHRHLDLEAANTRRLLAAGIPPDRIHPKRCCTYESSVLPSWRRAPSEQRLLTWISMLP